MSRLQNKYKESDILLIGEESHFNQTTESSFILPDFTQKYLVQIIYKCLEENMLIKDTPTLFFPDPPKVTIQMFVSYI